MPEHFRVVCIVYKALYKCSDFIFNQVTGVDVENDNGMVSACMCNYD